VVKEDNHEMKKFWNLRKKKKRCHRREKHEGYFTYNIVAFNVGEKIFNFLFCRGERKERHGLKI
jgi:hypothetical protein